MAAQLTLIRSQGHDVGDPSVTVNGTDLLLGTADVVYAGVAGIDALGGAFQERR